MVAKGFYWWKDCKCTVAGWKDNVKQQKRRTKPIQVSKRPGGENRRKCGSKTDRFCKRISIKSNGRHANFPFSFSKTYTICNVQDHRSERRPHINTRG